MKTKKELVEVEYTLLELREFKGHIIRKDIPYDEMVKLYPRKSPKKSS